MTDRTITALFETKADAERAREQLNTAGKNRQVEVHEQGQAGAAPSGKDEGFMEKVKDFFGGHEDAHAYGEGMRRGHFLLTAKVDEMDADEVARILEASKAIDFERTQQKWRGEGWTGKPAGEEQVIPMLEERLRVGKREVERGGVRVRSYVVETPVQEQIGLREERVSIERRPLDRPVAGNEAAFKDRNIELTETAEEAVVAKDTVVREEVVVRKQASERVEEVNDTVRKTEVDIQDTTGRSGEPRPGATPPRNV